MSISDFWGSPVCDLALSLPPQPSYILWYHSLSNNNEFNVYFRRIRYIPELYDVVVCLPPQPVYLDFRLQHRKQGKSITSMKRARLCKSVSVNGEIFSPSQPLNIHDYAVFMREEHLSEKFMKSIRRRASSPNVDRDDISRALKRFRFRSESEPESDTDAELSSLKTLPENAGGAGDGDIGNEKIGVVSEDLVAIVVGGPPKELAPNGSTSPLTRQPHPLHGMNTMVAPGGSTAPPPKQQRSSDSAAAVKKAAPSNGLCHKCCVVL